MSCHLELAVLLHQLSTPGHCIVDDAPLAHVFTSDCSLRTTPDLFRRHYAWAHIVRTLCQLITCTWILQAVASRDRSYSSCAAVASAWLTMSSL